jgi:hypothetical protein
MHVTILVVVTSPPPSTRRCTWTRPGCGEIYWSCGSGVGVGPGGQTSARCFPPNMRFLLDPLAFLLDPLISLLRFLYVDNMAVDPKLRCQWQEKCVL